MRAIRFLFFLISSLFTINACQNELDPTLPIPAQGTLHDVMGDCFPANVQGVYTSGDSLTVANFIDLNVLVTTPGNYELETDTINGYYFHAAGSFTTSGMNTIRMSGTGQPDSAGTNLFNIRFDTSVCVVAVTVTPANTPDAIFTLGNTSGICTGAILAGDYLSNSAMTTANTVTLGITVTTAGNYNITTPTVNGVSFTGSGTLSASTTSIILAANGTSSASATDVNANYPVTAGGSTCSFSVTYVGVPAGPASFTFDCATMDPIIASVEELRLGIPLDPAVNVVTVDVNVITPGTYSISSVTSLGGPDGVSFNSTGSFTTTGIQTLTLRPTGTPTRPAFVFYNISSPEATNPTPCSTGAYYDFLRSSIGTSFNRNFTFSSETVNDNTTVPGYDLVRIKGFAGTGSNESLELIIGLPTGGSFNTVGTTDVVYTVNDSPSKYVKAIYSDGSTPQVIYSAETNGTVQTNPFTVTITFCTAGRIEGNFSGTVKDNNGAGPGTQNISGSFGLVR